MRARALIDEEEDDLESMVNDRYMSVRRLRRWKALLKDPEFAIRVKSPWKAVKGDIVQVSTSIPGQEVIVGTVLSNAIQFPEGTYYRIGPVLHTSDFINSDVNLSKYRYKGFGPDGAINFMWRDPVRNNDKVLNVEIVGNTRNVEY